MNLLLSLARVVAGVIATIAVLGAVPADAQETDERAACTVAPRDVEELAGFYFDAAGNRLPVPEVPSVDSEAELPSGDPVDPLTEAEVDAVLTEFIACIEAEQFARTFALMTDDLVRLFAPGVGNPDQDTPEEVRDLLEAQLAETPAAEGPGMEAAGQGREMRVLADERVGGIWTVEGDAAFVVLEQQADDRWLIDGFIDIVEDDMIAAATPAP